MWKFVCEHIVPGCTEEILDESREEVVSKAVVHLEERHALDPNDDRIAEALKTTGVIYIQPT
jgi:predicted small metal-binding protein